MGDQADKCWTGIMLATLLRVCIHSKTHYPCENINSGRVRGDQGREQPGSR